MDWKFFLRRKQGGERRLLNNCPIKKQSPCHSRKPDSASTSAIDPPRLATSTAKLESLLLPISSISISEILKSPLSASEQAAVHARTTTIANSYKSPMKSASSRLA
jgi:hypothetical protein